MSSGGDLGKCCRAENIRGKEAVSMISVLAWPRGSLVNFMAAVNGAGFSLIAA